MSHKIVRAPDLREQVFGVLKARILSGEFDENTKFQEISLSEELGVSRTPVREALAMLVHEGLLVARGRGFRLPKFSPAEVRDIIEVRLQLEPFAIRRVIEACSAEQTSELARRIVEILENSNCSGSYAQAHQAARNEIYKYIPNPVLVETLRRFENSINYLRIITLKNPETRSISHTGMLSLANAIGSRDTSMASALMTQQLINARIALTEAVSPA